LKFSPPALSSITVDTSATAAWFLPDEASPAADLLFLEAVSGTRNFQAPALWAWETGNLLQMARRRGRLNTKQLSRALQLLDEAKVRLEPAPTTSRMAAILQLAAKHTLTFYDASYLEQCQRTGSALASKDRALLLAAADCQVASVNL
jgi:predicted nucleic acid-binding protein